jgi:ubiquitin C-terminal hydrolase
MDAERALGHALRAERHVGGGNVRAARLHYGRVAHYARQARESGGALSVVHRAETVARNVARAIKETVEREVTAERLGALAALAAAGVTGALIVNSMREPVWIEEGASGRQKTFDAPRYDEQSGLFALAAEKKESTLTGGISNYGNTCYLNAALQCLLAVPEFSASGPAKGPYAAIKAAIERGVSPSRSEIVALRDAANQGRGAKGSPMFAKCSHEDMHEFMKAISDGPMGPFAFKIRSVFSCHRKYDKADLGEKYTNETLDDAQEISLPLGTGADTSIVALMRQFLAEESMSDQRLEKDACSDTNRTTRLLLETAPKVLVVHLKRFMNDGTKNESRVTFEETLDLGQVAGALESHYDLIALSVHSGSKNGGHYWAFVKKQVWAKYNDKNVTPADFSGVLNEGAGGPDKPTAYVLVYRRSV